MLFFINNELFEYNLNSSSLIKLQIRAILSSVQEQQFFRSCELHGETTTGRCEFCEYRYVDHIITSGAQLTYRASSHTQAMSIICVTKAEYARVTHTHKIVMSTSFVNDILNAVK